MKKITIMSLVVYFLISTSFITQSSQEDGFYYSDKMVTNSIFVWNVTISDNYYEDIPEGANYTVHLYRDLYPGPLSEEDLVSINTSVTVDGETYTSEGFPLIWHVNRIESGITTTIREEFELESYLFNVSDAQFGRFEVNFTVSDGPYILFVEFEIDPEDGLAKRYYEFFTDGEEDQELELVFIDYFLDTETIYEFRVILLSIGIICCLLILYKKRK